MVAFSGKLFGRVLQITCIFSDSVAGTVAVLCPVPSRVRVINKTLTKDRVPQI